MVKEIIKVWDETSSKKDIYKMTHTNTALSIKELEDSTNITPINFILYTDVNAKGEENEVLAILDAEGCIYTTISATFKTAFFEMVDNFEMDFTFEKISGVTKAGREFVTCQLA